MTDHRPAPGTPSPSRNFIEWAVILGVAVVIALVVRAFVFQTFYIPSASMVPRLEEHDRVLVSQLTYRFREPHRGDVVVFGTPKAAQLELDHLVKRIVGLPGDTIAGRDGDVFINGTRLDEPYLPADVTTAAFPTRRVPSGTYFMMGDNRASSDDSRVWGPAERDLFVGPVFLTIWPLDRIDVPGWLWSVPITIGVSGLVIACLRRRSAPRGVGG